MICHLHYEAVPCAQCASRKASTVREGLPAPSLILFKEGVYEHLDLTPQHIATPQQLRDACERNGLTSQYLRDSLVFRERNPKWQ